MFYALFISAAVKLQYYYKTALRSNIYRKKTIAGKQTKIVKGLLRRTHVASSNLLKL